MKKSVLLILILIYTNKIQSQNYDIFYYMNYVFYLAEIDKKDANLKVGFLNKKGAVITEAIYSDGLNYLNDIANVVKDSVSGYIDKSNKLILFPEFKKAYWNGKIGYAINKNKEFALIDMQGNKITDFKYNSFRQTSENYISVKENGIRKFIDINGKDIFNDSINIIDRGIFNSLAVYEGKNNKFGLIHINGSLITEPLYSVIYGESYSKNWLVKKENKYGVINSLGNIVIPIIHDKIEYVVNENNPVPVKNNNKFGYILNSKEIIPYEYDEALPFKNGIARVKKDGKYHFINTKNKILCSFNHDGGGDCCMENNYFSNGRYIFKSNGKYGYINKRGKVVIDPIYDKATKFKEGIALVSKDGLSGFINNKGKIIIPIEYELLSDINDGRIMFGMKF